MPKEWIVSEPPTGASSPDYLAVSFDQERLARQAYDQAQALLFKEACELSAFRFYVGPTWYVAIIGETPLSHLETQLKHLLRRGKATTLPSGVIDELLQRRSKATSTSDVDCSQTTSVLRASGGRPQRPFRYTPRVWAVSLAWTRATRPQRVLASVRSMANWPWS